MLSVDALVDPDNPTARQWVRDELSKAVYAEQNSAWARLRAWIAEHLHDLLSGVQGGGSPVPPVVAGVVVALLAAAAIWSLRYVRRDQRQARVRGPVLGAEALTAAQFRERALAAQSRGDHAGAVIDGMRYLAQSAAERTLLQDAPSRTAHEIAAMLSTPFPDDAGQIAAAADLFDATAYGRLAPDGKQAQGLLDLSDRLAATRPAVLTPLAPRRATSRDDPDPGSAFRAADQRGRT